MSICQEQVHSKNLGANVFVVVQVEVELSVTDIWIFCVWYESFLEVTAQSLRLLFLTETDLKSFLRYYENCDNEINKLPLSIIIQYFITTM